MRKRKLQRDHMSRNNTEIKSWRWMCSRLYKQLAKILQFFHGYSQRSPCGHLAITDTPLIRTAAESPAGDWNSLLVLRTLATYLQTTLSVPTAQQWARFYCPNSRYNGHQSASFNILAELSQIIIYLFLFFSSSLSFWLKSEHSDPRV